MVKILPFIPAAKKGWSQAEQAEFVRAITLLRGTGLPVVTETGLSDEGDPWTVFLREDTGDVVVHISKIDGCVVAASAASEDVVSGPSFRAVMDRIIRSQPLILPTKRSDANVLLHPSAVITAFIATALVWSYSEEASVQQYDWRIASDGTVQAGTIWPRAVQSASILRDAVLSKAEAMAGSFDNANSLSSRFALAASMAAVAMVAELAFKPAVTDQLQILASDGPFEGEGAHAANAGQTTQMARAHLEDLFERDADATDAPSYFPLLDDHAAAVGRAEAKGQATNSSGDSPSSYGTAVADRAPAVPDLSANASVTLDGPAQFALDFAPPGVSSKEHAAQETIASVEVARETVHDPVRTSDSAPSPAKALVSHVMVSADATELLTLIFSPKELSDASPILSHIVAHQGVQFDVEQLDVAQGVQPSNDGVNLPVDSPASTDRGYRLLEDILAFAFDQSREISTPQFALQNFSTVLKANSFLPAADRVLIVDIPDLRADAFKFTDGLVMISQELAAQLLPDVALQSQSELGLANGSILKLIGVIDMTPDANGYVA